MVTQYINVSRAEVRKLFLNVSIVFASGSNCDGEACTLGIMIFETNDLDEGGRSDPASYTTADLPRLSFKIGDMQQDISQEVSFSGSFNGLYLAIVAPPSQNCVTISRIALFYYICPEQEMNLVKYPEVVAPDSRGIIDTAIIQGTCVDNAEASSSSLSLTLKCESKGFWASSSVNVSCECEEGFFVMSQSSAPFCQGK